MNVVPAHLQGKPHQVRPMWTASKILRRLVDGGLPATAPADEGAAPDEILAGSLPADRRDERRIPRHDNGVAARVDGRHKAIIESVRATVAHRELLRGRLAEISRVLMGMRCKGFASGAQKIRRPSSGGGKLRGDFSFGRSLSRTSTLRVKAPYRLQRQAADSVSRVTPDAEFCL